MPLPLGQFLRQWRTELGYSQEQLAQKAGIGLSTLRRWEQGRVQPRLVELDRLLDALSLPLAERLQALSLIDKPRASQRLDQLQRPELPLEDVFQEFEPLPGRLLQAMRRRSGLTGQQAALRLGVSPSLLSLWESSARVPAPHQFAALFALYQADPEEQAALSQERWRLNGQAAQPPVSLDACEAQMQTLLALIRTDLPFLGDLRFLQLEAMLWPLAQSQETARLLLAEVYGWHAEWLHHRGRYGESGPYAQRYLDLMPREDKPPPLWTQQIGLLARCASNRPGKASPVRGFALWREALPTAKEAGCETAAYREMADYAMACGRSSEAFSLIELAHQTASHIEDPWPKQAANKIHARLLVEADRQREAVPRLIVASEMEECPLQQVYTDCLWADVLLALASRAEAAERVRHAYRLIETFALEHWRSEVDRWAQRL